MMVFLPKRGTTRNEAKVAKSTTKFKRIGIIFVISPVKMTVPSSLAYTVATFTPESWRKLMRTQDTMSGKIR
jgi:hypothetical protein